MAGMIENKIYKNYNFIQKKKNSPFSQNYWVEILLNVRFLSITFIFFLNDGKRNECRIFLFHLIHFNKFRNRFFSFLFRITFAFPGCVWVMSSFWDFANSFGGENVFEILLNFRGEINCFLKQILCFAVACEGRNFKL